jgi:hypothetical protein
MGAYAKNEEPDTLLGGISWKMLIEQLQAHRAEYLDQFAGFVLDDGENKPVWFPIGRLDFMKNAQEEVILTARLLHLRRQDHEQLAAPGTRVDIYEPPEVFD